jgi:hypothetical protein
MALDRKELIALVSDGTGDPERAAKALGIQPGSIKMWRVDEDGRVVSRRVMDAVIAALVRKHWAAMIRGKKAMPVPADVMDSLLSLDGLQKRE